MFYKRGGLFYVQYTVSTNLAATRFAYEGAWLFNSVTSSGLQIVTLRTMRHMLTALLSRLHAAAAHLAITPELVNSQRECGRGGTAEKVDGSTARAVAAVADAVAHELLAAAHALGDLQGHLDQQVDGYTFPPPRLQCLFLPRLGSICTYFGDVGG